MAARQRLDAITAKGLSTKTWAQRRRLLERILESQHKITPRTAAEWVAAQPISLPTALGYSATIATTLKQLGYQDHKLTPLRLMSKGLRASGATIPSHQAVPARRDEILSAMAIAPAHAAEIAAGWKAASRWGDLSKLTRRNFIIDGNSVIVDWHNKAKTSKSTPFTARRYTVLQGKLVTLIKNRLRLLSRNQKFTSLSPSQVTRILRQVNPRLTSYSIRHGAANVMARAAAKGLISPEALARTLKHKQLHDLPDTTIRYIQDRPAAARMLGTQHATRVL